MEKKKLKNSLKGVSLGALLTLALGLGSPAVTLSQQGSSG